MTTPNRDRAAGFLSNPDSRLAEPSGPPRTGSDGRSAAFVRRPAGGEGSFAARPEETVAEEHAYRVRFRPQVGLLEQRPLLSALPTITALRASTVSAAIGQSVTFTATVSDLSAGGAIPTGGTVTFSEQGGSLGTATLVNGVAEFTTSSLVAGETSSRPRMAAPRASPRAPPARS